MKEIFLTNRKCLVPGWITADSLRYTSQTPVPGVDEGEETPGRCSGEGVSSGPSPRDAWRAHPDSYCNRKVPAQVADPRHQCKNQTLT
jgi:hypothetical protein